MTFSVFLFSRLRAVRPSLAKKLDLSSNREIGGIGWEKLTRALPSLKNLEETWLGSLSLAMDVPRRCVHTLRLLHDRIEDIK